VVDCKLLGWYTSILLDPTIQNVIYSVCFDIHLFEVDKSKSHIRQH
jgi:hypothetical protein